MIPYQTPCGFIRFHAWNHMIPSTETHGNHGCHGYMQGIAWNCVDQMIPCMGLHGSLMNSHPDNYRFFYVIIF